MKFLVLPDRLPIPVKQWLVAHFPGAAEKYRDLRSWVKSKSAI